MNVIQKQIKIEEIISKYNDIIGENAKLLQQEYALSTAQEMQESIKKIESSNRLLRIGIIGRVKAGKSSLINALLFNGQSVLPKAATPMTAALTVISYGEKLSAEVEFFDVEDIENIKKEAEEYNHKFQELKNRAFDELKKKKVEKLNKKSFLDNLLSLPPSEKKELEEKAERRAKRELKENSSLSSSFELWSKIEDSNIDYLQLPKTKIINSDSLENLSKELLEYVGADGKYMPFTKSVNIKIPQENLKGIEIVDTPGVNDPVQSREERTRELLKFCDVVFIVSPSGQFISSEDLDLMDRITSKEGIRELNVIASQIDLQLFGNVKEESNADLNKALSHIIEKLSSHLNNTLTNLKKTNPEVGTTYDELITQSREKVIHSSGICFTIKELFDQKDLWDDGIKTVWNNLKQHYPEYFSEDNKELSIKNLDLLANISTITEILDNVKIKKEEIIERKIKEFIEAKSKSLNNFQQELINYIDNRIKTIKNSNIEEIKDQIKNLTKIKAKASDVIDKKYADLVEDLEIEMKNNLLKELKKFFREPKKTLENVEGFETETYEVDNTKWYKPWTWFNGKEKKHYTYTTIRAGAVRNSLEELIDNIEDLIDINSKNFIKDWKEKLQKELIKTLRNEIGDENLEVNQIESIIRKILVEIKDIDISFDNEIPSKLKRSGTLRGTSAEKFIEDVENFIYDLQNKIRNSIKNYIKDLISNLESIEISKIIFEKYDEELENLKKEILYKELYIDKLTKLKNELLKV